MVHREKEKRGREKDKEIEKMAIYIIAICNCITDVSSCFEPIIFPLLDIIVFLVWFRI